MHTTLTAMSDLQFRTLRLLVRDRSGIHLTENRKPALATRLSPRLGELGLADFDQYIALLKMSPCRDEEFQELLLRCTSGEAGFFRNETQFEYFERTILTRLLEARASQKLLRIWCAACATGEDAYTLAILVHRTLGLRLADWNIEILGTDMSASALELSREGRYPESSLRRLPPLVRQRYFRRSGAAWQLNDDIRSLVCFERQNLNARLAARRHSPCDVIICRDALAHFDDALRSNVLDHFGRQLAGDGYLLTGRLDAANGELGDFSPVSRVGAFCFQKSSAPAVLLS